MLVDLSLINRFFFNLNLNREHGLHGHRRLCRISLPMPIAWQARLVTTRLASKDASDYFLNDSSKQSCTQELDVVCAWPAFISAFVVASHALKSNCLVLHDMPISRLNRGGKEPEGGNVVISVSIRVACDLISLLQGADILRRLVTYWRHTLNLGWCRVR